MGETFINVEQVKQRVLVWMNEQLQHSCPEIIKQGLQSEEVALKNRRSRIDHRLFDIEVAKEICDLYLSEEVPEADSGNVEVVSRRKLALVKS